MVVDAPCDEMELSLVELAILCLIGEEASADELAQRLAERGLQVDDAALRSALRSLEHGGFLRGRREAPRSAARRYVLSDRGEQSIRRLARLLPHWRALLDELARGGRASPSSSPEPASLAAERAAVAAERQEVERLRSDLLSTVSHELRTPLTLVRTSVGLLLDSDPDPAMRARLLQNIKHSAARMHALVTDLLDLVRLHSGKAELRLRYVDVGELAVGAAGLMGALLEQKGQMLELAVPSPAPKVMGDHRRLEQVLLNLLSNANKFAPSGARVCVSVAEGGAEVVIAVSDTGPGITPEAQARLFEQFYTARTSSPSHNIGAGLGLPIAKGIVEAHGGRIWVESEVGAGSTFYCSFPKEGPEKGELGGAHEDTGS